MWQRPRFLLLLSLIALVAIAASPIATVALPSDEGRSSADGAASGPVASVPAAPTPAGQAAQLTPEMLSGLRLRNIGPAVMSGRFVDIEVVESDPYEFLVASSTGGIFRTINNGVTFTPIFENEATHSIGDIALFQPDPNIIWVGTGERANRQSSSWGDGIYKSTDRGATWANVGLRDSHHIGRILTHPSDPEVAYVAAMGHLWGPNEERGLYKTEDGGRTWQRLLYIDEDTGVVDVAMHPSEPDTLYAATYQRRRKAFGFHGGGPGSALYKSTDGGATWENLSHENGLPEGDYGRIGISIYAGDPNIVYICIEQGRKYTASTSYEERLAGIYRSENKGASWEHMSDWNPRPMYASQILVDPTNDQRIYMQNSFSVSEDGGRTFQRVRQTVHGDDRFVWVDPADSRHLIKASDGAVGITYDRGDTWLFVETLPVSQFYRVGVDMSHPYRVVGGLQDNGTWIGPSANYRAEGILNEEWLPIGGGDGFFSLADPRDPDIIYTESQYLGLSKVDMRTMERRNIRPGTGEGFLGGRRNWDVWGQDKATPVLGNNMLPANWDGPFLLSPHDPSVIYAGTNEVWKSTDGGNSWASLGDLTTRIDRVELTIMGQHPNAETISLDDGAPYYPTTSYLAESPLRQGLLYIGTDDGNFQMSDDGGETWTNLTDRFPGLPAGTWMAGIEPSRFAEGTVYAVFDGHRDDDFENYIYKSTDYGQTFSSIVGDLPAQRVVRAIKEDLRNPNLLYIATEFGFFVSVDGGGHWVELKNNMPTLPFNDMVIHPRDNDLVLGSHGRGIWILDSISALQELTPEVMASPAHLFSTKPAEQIRYARMTGAPGHNIYYGENPADGAIIDYWLAEAGAEVGISVHDQMGAEVASVEATSDRGINRVIWDLRHAPFSPPAGSSEEGDSGGFGGGQGRGPDGPYVVPGTYIVRLSVAGRTYENPMVVSEDPRIKVGLEERRAWTHTLLRVGGMYEVANQLVRALTEHAATLGEDAASDLGAESEELSRLAGELRRRTRSLYGSISGWTGGPTADQVAQMSFFAGLIEELKPRVAALTGVTIE